ncbi:MAG: glycine cleavage system aminomethyltransferase GcvT [Candidatus Omnitrophica bacterium]|nr:glycine cleavage system aminomethyltransferase GcvT [Candidatus Omnitrophota bacterium]
MNTEAHKTVLYDEHVALGAHMVEFHGSLMPMEYAGIIAEHTKVRNDCGIFDVSHMGELEVRGEGAFRFLQHAITNDLSKSYPGKALYSPLCNEQGGIVDDIIVYCFSRDHYLLVVNSANRQKDFAWLQGQAALFDGVVCNDISDTTALIAVQGPRAEGILGSLLTGDISSVPRYTFRTVSCRGIEVMAARTGYTGEDGFELFIAVSEAALLWRALLAGGASPCGLGARDTLRLEACYPLYGNELTDETTPLEACLSWAVSLEKGEFVGGEVLRRQSREGMSRKLVGFEVVDRGIARSGYPVSNGDGKVIGAVTSGTFGPHVKKNIGLAYVGRQHSAVGSRIFIQIRNSATAARVVARPFYRTEALLYKK